MAVILFCEDNASIRKLISAALRDSGHTILMAEDGAAGLAMARARRPDLLVSDLAMPELNGLELHAAVRADPALANIKIAFLTASTQQGLMSRARMLDVEALMTKPFSPKDLRQRLEQILAGPGARA